MRNEWPRVIVHVDMDAFFAAVEQLRNPGLRGKPVIVGADPKGGKGRGVVSTASYEARKFGVHSAMPISQAYRRCPQGVFVPPSGKIYQEYAQQIFAVLEQFSPQIQIISIDEAFLDVTASLHLFPSIEELGRQIKSRVYRETGLRASVGIAPSKSVAKIASDFQKPDGLTIVPPEQVQDFLDALPATRLWGVGKKTFVTLAKLGIRTVRQLREYPLDYLESQLGKMGPHLHRMARGIDERDVHDRDDVKSISHERTFSQDQTDPEQVLSTLLWLSEKVAARLRKHNFRGKTIQLKLRFADFSTFTRSKTLPHHTNLTEDIFSVSKHLYEQFGRKTKAIRLIGVGVSQLAGEAGMQTSIWDVQNQRKLQLEKVLDELQERFGKSALTHARALEAQNRPKQKKPQPKKPQ